MSTIDFNISDFIATAMSLLFFIILILLTIKIFGYFKNSKEYKKEALKLEKQNIEQITEINKRLISIEKKLEKK